VEEQGGFTIEGRFYPWPESFRIGDPVLIRELTGYEWEDFAARLDDGPGMDMLAGLVGVAVWQGNPRWRRDRVLEYVQRIDIAAIDFPEVASNGGDAGPPEPTGGGSPEASSSPDAPEEPG
jgi:hypothetical protein